MGTEVSGNSIVSKNSMIKLGIAIGVLSWGVDNRTIARESTDWDWQFAMPRSTDLSPGRICR